MLYIEFDVCYALYIICDVPPDDMEIYDYSTAGGKNLIMEFILSQSVEDKTLMLDARKLIRDRGIKAFSMLDTRQLKGKLYEIRIRQNRIMYIIVDMASVYFLHVCKKQKGKAEKQELRKAIVRAKAAGLM